MESCRSCGAALSLGASDCGVCSTPLRLEPPGRGTGEQLDPNEGFVANLFDGNYGLPKTYWLFGVVANWVLGLVAALVIAISQSLAVTVLGIMAIGAYQVLITIAIWNAASKYPGSKVWAVLARVGSVLGVIQFVNAVVGLVL
jgi:hypothetical protein